jgi:hypothetical protein
VAEHAGWAHVVCVAVRENRPVVIARRRITIIDPGVPTQPYHHEATAMTDADANALITRVRRSIATRSSSALQSVVTDLAPDYAAVAVAIRKAPFDDLPEMYQLAICGAARRLELEVHMCPRGEEASWAAKTLGVAPGDIRKFVSETGRPPGPPWTEEHKRGYAAGIAVLAGHAAIKLSVC